MANNRCSSGPGYITLTQLAVAVTTAAAVTAAAAAVPEG